MNIRTVIAIILLFTLSTITLDPKIVFSKFKINKINIENNFLLKEVEIKNLLIDIYSQNLLLEVALGCFCIHHVNGPYPPPKNLLFRQNFLNSVLCVHLLKP